MKLVIKSLSGVILTRYVPYCCFRYVTVGIVFDTWVMGDFAVFMLKFVVVMFYLK